VVATLDGRGSLLGEEAGAEALLVDRVQRAAWAGLVEKAAKYDQAGLLALEQGWHDSGAAEGRPTEDGGS
jgi:hypothetical protein